MDHTCEYEQLLMGGASIDVHGIPSDGRDQSRQQKHAMQC